jgi:hypothetical protein
MERRHEEGGPVVGGTTGSDFASRATTTAKFGGELRGDELQRVKLYSVSNPEGQSGEKFEGISFGTTCNRQATGSRRRHSKPTSLAWVCGWRLGRDEANDKIFWVCGILTFALLILSFC